MGCQQRSTACKGDPLCSPEFKRPRGSCESAQYMTRGAESCRAQWCNVILLAKRLAFGQPATEWSCV